MDPELYTIRTMAETVANNLARQRFSMTVLAVFAAVALALALIGIYGVVSHVAAQRNREIGLGMALSASKADVLKIIVMDAMRRVSFGIALGLTISLPLSRAMRRLIFGVSSIEAPTLLSLTAVTSLLASYIPARRPKIPEHPLEFISNRNKELK